MSRFMRRGERSGCDAKHQGFIDQPASRLAQIGKETAADRPAWMVSPELLPKVPPPLPRTDARPMRRSDDPGR
ncbi:MAG TPA: hypothetical protein VKU41_20180 [Polyangiaceae bacterium]|nr:hypothetical protein [Polyangiaceae bacterium]